MAATAENILRQILELIDKSESLDELREAVEEMLKGANKKQASRT